MLEIFLVLAVAAFGSALAYLVHRRATTGRFFGPVPEQPLVLRTPPNAPPPK